MTHNLRGGDPLQPRSPDRRSPIRQCSPPRKIVREGIEYAKLTDTVDYPPEFSPGARGTRVGNLNRTFLQCLGMLAYALNEVSFAKAVLKHNEPLVHPYQKVDLREEVHEANKQAQTVLALTRDTIGELDAVGGSDAYHVPLQWAKIIGGPEKWRRVESGSLAHLASGQHYLAEEDKAEDPAAYVGAKGDNFARLRFDKVAHTINRIGYLKACNCKDKTLEDLLDSLKKQVRDVILHAGEGTTLLMPDCIRQEVVRVLDEEKEEREREQKRKQKEKKRKPLTSSIFGDLPEDEVVEVTVPEEEDIATRTARREEWLRNLEDKEKKAMDEAERSRQRLIGLEKKEAASIKRKEKKRGRI